MKTWWWLSFCDGNKPQGQQFLGVVLVYAKTIEEAVTLTHLLGINPGGEVGGWAFPQDVTAPDPRFRNRLLNIEDLIHLDGCVQTVGDAEDAGIDAGGAFICGDCNAGKCGVHSAGAQSNN